METEDCITAANEYYCEDGYIELAYMWTQTKWATLDLLNEQTAHTVAFHLKPSHWYILPITGLNCSDGGVKVKAA